MYTPDYLDNGSSLSLRAYRPEEQVDSTLHRATLMDRTLDLLIAKTHANELWPELYERALHVLECLPLTTDDFALALKRLRNALAYASTREHGAAAFELRLLRTQLAQ